MNRAVKSGGLAFMCVCLVSGLAAGVLAVPVPVPPPPAHSGHTQPVPPPPPPPPRADCTFVVLPSNGAVLWKWSGKSWEPKPVPYQARLRYGKYKFRADAVHCTQRDFTVQVNKKTFTYSFRLECEGEGQGKVKVGRVVPDNAVIYVGDQQCEPGQEVSTNSGEAKVTISAGAGYRDFVKTVVVKVGETVEVGDVTLEPIGTELTVNIDGPTSGAKVILTDDQGEERTLTPGEPTKLPQGNYTLIASAEGYATYSERLQVGDRPIKGKITLKQARAALRVSVEPAGLPGQSATLDGDRVDVSYVIYTTPDETHHLIVSAPGYKTWTWDVEPKSDETLAIPVKLEALANKGTLSLTTSPDDAEVLIDGSPVQEREVQLEPGSHELAVSKYDYVTQTKSIQIAENATLDLTVELEQEYYIQASDLCDKIEGMEEANSDVRTCSSATMRELLRLCRKLGELADAHADDDASHAETWKYARWSAQSGAGFGYAQLALMPGGDKTDFELAKAALRRAIEIDPERADAYHALATVLMMSRIDSQYAEAFSEALRTFEKALELDPSNPLIHMNYAFCLLMAKDKTKARAEASRAIELGMPEDDVPEELR